MAKELVHYKIGDNAWVVDGDPQFLRKHLNLGFWQDESGRIICTDPGMLYLCGRLIRKRRFFGRRSSMEVSMTEPYVKALKKLRRDRLRSGCPHDHGKCIFWNGIFQVCSAKDDAAREKRGTPCYVAQLKSKEQT